MRRGRRGRGRRRSERTRRRATRRARRAPNWRRYRTRAPSRGRRPCRRAGIPSPTLRRCPPTSIPTAPTPSASFCRHVSVQALHEEQRRRKEVEQEATGRIEALAGRLETEKARRKEATKEANQAREARSAPPCWASLDLHCISTTASSNASPLGALRAAGRAEGEAPLRESSEARAHGKAGPARGEADGAPAPAPAPALHRQRPYP